MHFLEKIVEAKKRELRRRKEEKPLGRLKEEIEKNGRGGSLPGRNFKTAIGIPGRLNLIAEIKRASPSKGLIRAEFDPLAIARIYAAGGAAALSVLTEEEYFLGSLAYLEAVKKAVGLPVLRKDFLIDEYQLYESRAAGSDAVLLIVRLLAPSALKRFLSRARKLGLDCLVEVHDPEEMRIAVAAGAEIIGINNRDLDTFRVDVRTTEKLLPLAGPGKVIVSESGIRSRKDVKYLAGLGVNAVLIGEAFMASEDIGAQLREMMGTD